jgi:hypothetical protein
MGPWSLYPRGTSPPRLQNPQPSTVAQGAYSVLYGPRTWSTCMGHYRRLRRTLRAFDAPNREMAKFLGGILGKISCGGGGGGVFVNNKKKIK